MEILIAVLGSSAVASLISGIFMLINNRRRRKTGLESGIRILLYDRIKELGAQYIKQDRITFEQYEDLLKMHSVYHSELGGNGFLDDIMRRVKSITPEVNNHEA